MDAGSFDHAGDRSGEPDVVVAQEGGFHSLTEWGAARVVEELLAEQNRHERIRSGLSPPLGGLRVRLESGIE